MSIIKKNTTAPVAESKAESETPAPKPAPKPAKKPAPKVVTPPTVAPAAAQVPVPPESSSEEAKTEVGRITRKELAASIQEKLRAAGKGVPLSICEMAVVAYEEAVGESLAALKEVVLSGFGKFIPTPKPEAERRNPLNNTMVTVPAHVAVRFKVGTKLKAAANGGTVVETGDED